MSLKFKGRPGEKIAGFLEVGVNNHEVVINYSNIQIDANGVGHIVFSPNQARTLAAILNKQAEEAEKDEE